MMRSQQTSFLFDLDGTLVDSVYQHVLSWHEALQSEGIHVSVWRIHRKIGMSGGLFTNILMRETGLHFDAACLERMHRFHTEAFARRAGDVRVLPGAKEPRSGDYARSGATRKTRSGSIPRRGEAPGRRHRNGLWGW